MAEAIGDLKESFEAYCQLTNKGSDKGNSMTIKKMCADAKVTGAKLNQNIVDIEFRKCFGNAKGHFDYEEFLNFVENFLSKIYAEANKISHEEGIIQVRSKLASVKPKLTHATKPSSDAVTARLTDVKTYTGSHKQRFDEETGKGLGKSGREYIPDVRAAEGYVTGYKNKDTYPKK